MITIKNTQRKIIVNTKQLKQDIQDILDLLHYSDFAVGVMLTTNKTIKHYNALYRHKDNPTDILAFPFHTTVKAGNRIKAKTSDEKNLGDLIISLEYVKNAAQELNTTFEQRLRILIVHGICHLLGYDHIKDTDYKKMHRKELFILNHLKN